jgi:hypothetical protein
MKNVLSFFAALAVLVIFSSTMAAFAQGTTAEITNSTISQSNLGSQFLLDVRGIDSTTSQNLIAMIYTGNDVEAQVVDVNSSQPMPNQSLDTFDPIKKIDVPISFGTSVEDGSEITACILELGQGQLDSIVTCSIAYSSTPSAGGPQKIVIPI